MARRWALRASRAGQVVVEMILILPVFLMIVFTIMEMGYLAYWVILLNHATWECARIGALYATPAGGGAPRDQTTFMQGYMGTMIKGANVTSSFVGPDQSYVDPQEQGQNSDLVVTANFSVPLIFPTSWFLLAKPPGSGHRLITATVYVPVERPLQQ